MNSRHWLLLTTLGAAILSAGCFSGAYALATANDSKSNEITTRELPWASDTLVLHMAANVHYTQAPGPGKVVARGPHRSVSTLAVDGGQVRDELLHSGGPIDLTITAPDVKSFRLGNRSRLVVENYDQPTLHLAGEGGAQIEASGRATQVTVDMQGRTTANLARLATEDLAGDVGGFTTLVAAPTNASRVHVRGQGSLVLVTRPAMLDRITSDAGRIVDAASR